jgi:formylglycine-generating enzyme required for sulfatase activity
LVLKIILAICLFNSSIYCFAQKKNPPGTILLKDNLYIDAMPILNVHYREYEHTMRAFFNFNLDTLEKIMSTLPYSNFDIGRIVKPNNFKINKDSASLMINDDIKTFWNGWIEYKTYLNHPRFNYFPMVNISYSVAAKFCKWRTLVVKILYASHNKRERKKMYDNLVYRLPTFEELELATKKFTTEKKFMVQVKAPTDSLPSFPEQPQSIELFRVSRLSEITTDNNFIRKAYWDTQLNRLIKDSLIHENIFGENLGFRCVCEVK